jgi:hypothetical protein
MGFFKDMDEKKIGRRMLLSAVKMEDSLAELLKAEAKILRKSTLEGASNEDIQRTNRVIRYLFFSLTMIDDRIKTGLSLMSHDAPEGNDKNVL